MCKLYFKKSTYVNEKNEEKIATNLFVKVGNSLIPVDIKYFPDKDTGVDRNYKARKSVFLALAEELPDKK